MDGITKFISELSKGTNEIFGDTSGRSISRRTAHGLKRVTGGNMRVGDAEDIVHLGMIVSGLALTSKDDDIKSLGKVGLLALFGLYHTGK